MQKILKERGDPRASMDISRRTAASPGVLSAPSYSGKELLHKGRGKEFPEMEIRMAQE